MLDIFASLYRPDADDFATFGPDYNPPESFQHGKDYHVLTIRSQADGQDAEVWECRLPATFYTIKALPKGDKPGYSMSTGSSMHALALSLARAIADGMISLNR
jgi:hypothetical protein